VLTFTHFIMPHNAIPMVILKHISYYGPIFNGISMNAHAISFAEFKGSHLVNLILTYYATKHAPCAIRRL